MDPVDTPLAETPEARAACRIAAAAPGQAGDAETELYRLLAPRARRYGLRYLRDTDAAADLMPHAMALTTEQLRRGTLPERERSVLVMTFYDDQPSDVVASQMGLSAGNVRVIRHRGLDKLRRCVDLDPRTAT